MSECGSTVRVCAWVKYIYLSIYTNSHLQYNCNCNKNNRASFRSHYMRGQMYFMYVSKSLSTISTQNLPRLFSSFAWKSLQAQLQLQYISLFYSSLLIANVIRIFILSLAIYFSFIFSRKEIEMAKKYWNNKRKASQKEREREKVRKLDNTGCSKNLTILLHAHILLLLLAYGSTIAHTMHKTHEMIRTYTTTQCMNI